MHVKEQIQEETASLVNYAYQDLKKKILQGTIQNTIIEISFGRVNRRLLNWKENCEGKGHETT